MEGLLSTRCPCALMHAAEHEHPAHCSWRRGPSVCAAGPGTAAWRGPLRQTAGPWSWSGPPGGVWGSSANGPGTLSNASRTLPAQLPAQPRRCKGHTDCYSVWESTPSCCEPAHRRRPAPARAPHHDALAPLLSLRALLLKVLLQQGAAAVDAFELALHVGLVLCAECASQVGWGNTCEAWVPGAVCRLAWHLAGLRLQLAVCYWCDGCTGFAPGP